MLWYSNHLPVILVRWHQLISFTFYDCRALESHPTASALLEQSTSTLCNLCTSNDTNKVLLSSTKLITSMSVLKGCRSGSWSSQSYQWCHDGQFRPSTTLFVCSVSWFGFQLDMLSTCMRCLGHLCNEAKNVTAVVKSGSIQVDYSFLLWPDLLLLLGHRLFAHKL